MAFILKELAGADELRTMKLAPAPNTSKANAVEKYRSILQNAKDSWDRESSYADSTSYNGLDSSQEKSLSVKQHHDKKQGKEQQEQQEKQQPEQQ